MNQSAGHQGAKPFTGRHMLTLIGLFFGTIITVNLFMAWNAVNSWTGLVVKNSYVESQRFNDVTAARIEGDRLGWKLATVYSDGTLRLDIADAAGAGITDAAIEAKLGRPVHENEDHTLAFTHQGGGLYSGQTALSGGVWQADFAISRPNGEVWQKSYRFLVKE